MNNEIKTNKIIAIIFSKSRAMQLDCCLKTLYKQCQDVERIDISVLYTTTSEGHEKSYDILEQTYLDVNFIKENNFKENLLEVIDNKTNVLFVVDDTIFIDEFYVADMADALTYCHNEYVLGASLRLGLNTTYCYPLNKDQEVPELINGWYGLKKFDWTKAKYDFNYPLEISSSFYRLKDLYSILETGNYNNPNELEYLLSINSVIFHKKYLLCYENSVAFSNPINKVQNVNKNKFAVEHSYSAEYLLSMFLDEFRIETTSFEDFMPHGCHEETELLFVKGENKND